jgi:hypothetical protein
MMALIVDTAKGDTTIPTDGHLEKRQVTGFRSSPGYFYIHVPVVNGK